MRWKPYAGTMAAVGAATGVAALMQGAFDLSNLSMVYLVAVVVSAIAFGRAPAIFSAFLSVLVFDFLFVPPRLTLSVADTQYLFTFAVMLLVAIVIGTLTAGLRSQLEAARLRERRTSALYRLTHDLGAATTPEAVARVTTAHVTQVLDAPAVLWLPKSEGELAALAGGSSPLAADPEAAAEARRAFEQREITGLAPDASVERAGLHVPLLALGRALGVLSIAPHGVGPALDPERFALVRAFAAQSGHALERCRLVHEADDARTLAESERSRSALLSSVSHDLRTPLTAITGAATSLRDDAGGLTPEARRSLLETMASEAQRLNRQIGNLLDMTRLESGKVQLRTDWHSLEEVVGAALVRLGPALDGRSVRVGIPRDLPLVPLDDVLFEQVVWNLVENAVKYSPAGTPIELSAAIEDGMLRFDVADRGPGIPERDQRRVFEKFHRGPESSSRPGSGLGLAICEAIVRVHGGRIEVSNRPEGGACFTIRMPIAGTPPVLAGEPAVVEARGARE